jgi:hypothetical protein
MSLVIIKDNHGTITCYFGVEPDGHHERDGTEISRMTIEPNCPTGRLLRALKDEYLALKDESKTLAMRLDMLFEMLVFALLLTVLFF